MDKRLIAAAAVVVAAVAVSGLSAAATTSPGADPAPEPARAKPVKAAPAATQRQRAQQNDGVVTSTPADPRSAGTYWTPERMQNAQPMERNVPSSSPPASAPQPSGSPGGTVRKIAPAAPKTSGKASAPQPGVVSESATGDAGAYWTKERMDAAQPRDMGVPTSGGGSTGTSGSGNTGDRIVVTSP